SIWFTDPAYDASLSEGRPDAAGGPTNPDGVFNPAIGTQGLADPAIKRELPNGIYRIDPSGRIDLAIGEDQLKSPNGLCFSKDYKAKLLGRLRLPENCANLTFGGPKRNFLFMTASQSLYAVQLQAQGAAPE